MLKKISYEMNDKGMIMKAKTMTVSTLNDEDDDDFVNDDEYDDDNGDGEWWWW